MDETRRLVCNAGADAQIIIADLSTPLGIDKIVSSCTADQLDVLINNAGVSFVRPFEKLTLDEWQKTLAINVTAPFLLTQKLLPRMTSGSSIVNILSVSARTGFPEWSSYCASKFALEGFSQSLREELRPRGIRVINIYPSATATAIWNAIQGEWPRDRMLPPEEVAEAVAYSLSRPASVLVDNIAVGHVSGTI